MPISVSEKPLDIFTLFYCDTSGVSGGYLPGISGILFKKITVVLI